jgi:hypothetical protein
MYSSLSFALLLCIFLSRISQSITCIMEITIGHYVLNEHIRKRRIKESPTSNQLEIRTNREDQLGTFHMLQSKASDGSWYQLEFNTQAADAILLPRLKVMPFNPFHPLYYTLNFSRLVLLLLISVSDGEEYLWYL